MENNENKKSLLQKLAEIKKGLVYLKKDGRSKGGASYGYVTPEQIYLKFNELANKEGVILLASIIDSGIDYGEQIKKKNGEYSQVVNMVNLKMEMTFCDVESDDKITRLWASFGCNQNEKGFGAALTYGIRYFLLSTFQIPTGNDDPDNYIEKKPIPEYIKAMYHTLKDIDSVFAENIKNNIVSLSEPKAIKYVIENIEVYLNHLVKKGLIQDITIVNAIGDNEIDKITNANYEQVIDIFSKCINSMGR